MMQSKRGSLIESTVNTASAFCISWFIQADIVPIIWPQVKINTLDAFGITVLFTTIAIVRNYLWRRFFISRDKYKQVWIHHVDCNSKFRYDCNCTTTRAWVKIDNKGDT